MRTSMMRWMTAMGAVVLLAGCTLLGGPGWTDSGTGGGAADPAVLAAERAQAIQDAAVIVKGAAREAAGLAIAKDAGNAKFVNLAVTTLDTFLVGKDYTPGALTSALGPVLKEAQDAKVRLAVNAVADLYQIFYGRYAKSQIAQNETAALFLTALRDGASQALPVTN